VHVWPASGDITQIAWLFQRPAGDTAGYAYFESEPSTAITIITQGSLTLAQALVAFGTPPALYTQTGKSGPADWVEVDLVYPAAGYVVEADINEPAASDKPQVTIGPSSPVIRVTYFAPQQFQALLANSIIIHGPAGLSPTALRPWPGLGVIAFTRS
jgi:hypothetical protein